MGFSRFGAIRRFFLREICGKGHWDIGYGAWVRVYKVEGKANEVHGGRLEEARAQAEKPEDRKSVV